MLEMFQKIRKQFSFRTLKKIVLKVLDRVREVLSKYRVRYGVGHGQSSFNRNVRCHMGFISMLKLFDKPQQDEKGRSHHLVLLSWSTEVLLCSEYFLMYALLPQRWNKRNIDFRKKAKARIWWWIGRKAKRLLPNWSNSQIVSTHWSAFIQYIITISVVKVRKKRIAAFFDKQWPEQTMQDNLTRTWETRSTVNVKYKMFRDMDCIPYQESPLRGLEILTHRWLQSQLVVPAVS